jgi:hypothetical protein
MGAGGREKGGGNREQQNGVSWMGFRVPGIRGSWGHLFSKLRGIGILHPKIYVKTRGDLMRLRTKPADDITRVVIFVGRVGWRRWGAVKRPLAARL